MTTEATPELDLREKIARIDRDLADHDRKRQEIRWYPAVLIGVAFGSGGAFFGGLLAALKAFGVIH
jgi:hypothetical protein